MVNVFLKNNELHLDFYLIKYIAWYFKKVQASEQTLQKLLGEIIISYKLCNYTDKSESVIEQLSLHGW